ncbi:hypothetical protein RRG08_026972 [Elysia crispata]|uniref:Uncharacterized protein n=1 Tax=Elysia crispata TaxID=231223 RepID=A0AAE0YRM0_9GAST|nr:hypothetical protein RRG08_026972 [Elysia crispata]
MHRKDKGPCKMVSLEGLKKIILPKSGEVEGIVFTLRYILLHLLVAVEQLDFSPRESYSSERHFEPQSIRRNEILLKTRMRPVMPILVVLLLSAAFVAGEESAKSRQRRFIGGILKIAETFKNRISGVAKDVGDAASSALKKGYKFSSKTMENQFDNAEVAFNQVSPLLDFDKALEKMIPLIDHDFTKVICEYSCNGAADKVLGIDTKSDDSSALAEIGCGPLCSGGLAKLRSLAEG